MDTLKAVLRKRSLFAFSLALALAACGSEDPKTTEKPGGNGDNNGDGDGDTGDGDGDTMGDGDGDTMGDGDGDGDGVVPEVAELPYAVDAFHVPSGFMGQGELMPAPIAAYPDATMDDSTCGGKRAPGTPVGACHTFSYTPVGPSVPNPNMYAWAGVFWQFGDGNWDLPGIKIAPGAKEIHFYARADGDVSIKVAAGMGDKSDAFHVESESLALTKEWKEYTISLAGIKYTTVNGAFAWTIDNMTQTGTAPFKFYLDDIQWR
jgi:hypothetical protein